MLTLLIITQILLAYLLGSIPTSVWVGKIFFKTDIRNHGSGNAGATNTLRVFGWKAGVPVLLFDIFKAWLAVKLPVIFFAIFEGEALVSFQILLGVIAVIGHVFPVFARFKGGKGVASITGIIIALFPQTFIVILVVFMIIVLISGYVSLASVTSALVFPFVAVLIFKEQYISLILFSVFVAIVVPVLHLKNIKRLLNGTESKIWKSSKVKKPD